jgi:hypothetical protein
MTRIFQTLLISSCLIALYSCKGQDGKKQGEELKGKIDGIMDTYHKPTSKDGLYLEANVDGKKWTADWMFVDPDPNKSFNVNAHKGAADEGEGGPVISFYISSSVVKEKGSKNFSDMNQVQMFADDNLLLGSDGSYQITNVTDNWIEGNFHFTAKDQKTSQTHEVTDGFFRVGMPDKWKKNPGM